MIVGEIIVSPAIAVRENCPLDAAAKLIPDGNIGCLPIVNENSERTGIVTDSNFVAKEKELPRSRFPRLYFGLCICRSMKRPAAVFTRRCIS